MRKELDYFTIEGAVGGNQDWFQNIVMNMGGCAAATACDSCIYFAKEKGMTHLYPFDVQQLSKEEYTAFAMKMKPYIKPRVSGVKKLSMYMEGFERYLADVGGSMLKMEGFSGQHRWEEAREFIKGQINAGYPVPYLMLKHTNTAYKDFMWHWFLTIGYEENGREFRIAVATYGEKTIFSLQDLWETGFEEKGGLIGYQVC